MFLFPCSKVVKFLVFSCFKYVHFTRISG